ncbi:MAG: hypothetical protein U0821_09520 [Chloroflexota bacterium]
MIEALVAVATGGAVGATAGTAVAATSGWLRGDTVAGALRSASTTIEHVPRNPSAIRLTQPISRIRPAPIPPLGAAAATGGRGRAADVRARCRKTSRRRRWSASTTPSALSWWNPRSGLVAARSYGHYPQ